MSPANAFYKKTSDKYTYFEIYVRQTGFDGEIGTVNHGCKGTEYVGCRYLLKTSSLNYAIAVINFLNMRACGMDFDAIHDNYDGGRRCLTLGDDVVFKAPTRY